MGKVIKAEVLIGLWVGLAGIITIVATPYVFFALDTFVWGW